MKQKLSGVCTIKYGKDHKHLCDGNIPVYGSGGVIRYVDTSLYNRKSVLIPRKGSLGNLFFVSVPFWTIDTLFYTQIDEAKVLPEYLYYFLKTLDLAEMNVGTAVPSLTTSLLSEIEIDVPPMSEQQIIADTLSALDDKISNNSKINHHLLSLRSAMDSSPDIRRGKRISRSLAKRRFSSLFTRICANSGSIKSLNFHISSSFGTITESALRFAWLILG